MKKASVFAWLVIIAMMAMNYVAIGEELVVDMPDDITLMDDLEVDMEEDGIALDIDGEGIQIDTIDVDLSNDLPYTSEDAVGDNATVNSNRVIRYQSDVDYDSDALFAGYVDMVFYGKDTLGIQPNNGFLGDRLTGVVGKVYDYLYQETYKVAIGERSYTRFVIPDSIITDQEDLDLAVSSFWDIVHSLLYDHPYTLYWCDKTRIQGNYDDTTLEFDFPVAEEFAKSDNVTDAEKIKSIETAHSNAKKVIKLYEDVPDYHKLLSYRDFICSSVDYNYEAAEDEDTPYGNPWQMIWVFDADPTTNVVCEGYSKAFQYLCAKTKFNGAIQSYMIGGKAEANGSGGPHMWNIITMEDGKNYHVDVTWYDQGFTGGFLTGATSQSNTAYVVADEATYYFDDVILELYPAKKLKLSSTDYDPEWSMPKEITIKQGDAATLYMGNKLTLKTKLKPSKAITKLKWSTDDKTVATVSKTGVVTPKKAGRAKITVTTDNGLSASIVVKVKDASSVKLMKGTKTLKKGTTLNLKRGKSLKLKAKVLPEKVKTKLTWKSSNKYVTVKNGTVKVNARAKVGSKARITVKTANGKSAYIIILVN
ncbi:MAG: Ig-like domain-containing protein [Clostridia bacterium]|nr:Ig-like domain-containing protein [Clostridia bacterium]